MVMPIKHVPKQSFQCGLESKSIHFVAQEAIRSVLTNGLKTIMTAYDDSVGNLIENIIEVHYKEDSPGKDLFQFLLVPPRIRTSPLKSFVCTGPVWLNRLACANPAPALIPMPENSTSGSGIMLTVSCVDS